MDDLVAAAGHVRPEAPAHTTPARAAGSVRRTSSLDLIRPGGLDDPLLQVRAAARELVTGEGGAAQTSDEAELDADVRFDASRALVAITTTPALERSGELLGSAVASGFRARAADVLAGEKPGSVLAGLLDDLPVAVLIAGYAPALAAPGPPADSDYHPKVDLCSGWRAEGTMMLSIGRGRPIPLTVGPDAPDLTGADPYGWHPLLPLPALAMRRVRRLDVLLGDDVTVEAMFRDSYVDRDGRESVVHEYGLRAVVDPATLVVSEISATPHVLPWGECPWAAASAGALVGMRVTDLSQRVRAELSGTSTCTHLNDLLRSLSAVAPMLSQPVKEFL